MGSFDLERLVEGFRCVGGDEVVDVAARAYGGDPSVTPAEWAPVWKLFGRGSSATRTGAERSVNQELNAPGLKLFLSFDVLALGRTLQTSTGRS